MKRAIFAPFLTDDEKGRGSVLVERLQKGEG